MEGHSCIKNTKTIWSDAVFPFLSGKQSIRAKELDACPASHLYKMFERSRLEHRDELRANIKIVLLSMLASPTTMSLSHAIKQALLFTCGNMRQLTLNHLLTTPSMLTMIAFLWHLLSHHRIAISLDSSLSTEPCDVLARYYNNLLNSISLCWQKVCINDYLMTVWNATLT